MLSRSHLFSQGMKRRAGHTHYPSSEPRRVQCSTTRNSYSPLTDQLLPNSTTQTSKMCCRVRISKAAKVAGVSVDTIRFYQKLGLIKSAGRSALKRIITAS
jgi:hypothetical protein